MDKQNLYAQLLVKYSDTQIIVAIEELSELQKEFCKFLRNKGNKNNLIEEIADVEIMLEQMKMYFNINEKDVDQIKQQKIERTKERLLNG